MIYYEMTGLNKKCEAEIYGMERCMIERYGIERNRRAAERVNMKAVVFDMDGVLFDTESISVQSWCEVAEMQGVQDMESVVMQCIGTNSNDARALLLNHYGQDFAYDAFKEKVWTWFENFVNQNGVPVKSGVHELLSYLQEQGYKIGLASSSRRETVLGNLEMSGLASFFSVIVTGDMVEHSKPMPDIYLLACEKLGVKPEETYAIEDSPNGIKSAYAAGMKAVMVPDLIQPDEEMRKLSFRIFEDLTEVQRYLEEQ